MSLNLLGLMIHRTLFIVLNFFSFVRRIYASEKLINLILINGLD